MPLTCDQNQLGKVAHLVLKRFSEADRAIQVELVSNVTFRKHYASST